MSAPRINAHVANDKVKADYKIAEKIALGQSAVFRNRFPGQIEHVLRLLTERLQAGLDKNNGVVIDNPGTWRMTALELSDLAKAVESIYNVYTNVGEPKPTEQNNDRSWNFDETSDPLGLRK